MSSLYHMPMFAAPVSAAMSMRDRSLIVAGVVLVHASLMWSWAALPNLSKPAHHEMSVSISMPSPPQTVAAKPERQPVAKPKPIEPPRQQPVPKAETPLPKVETPAAPVESPTPPSPAASTASAQPVAAASVQPENAAPGLPDQEPDYKAAYLNNPKPAYPMVARRMGWEGRVVFSVEVLASGLPGQIRVHQSSGHEALDNAALQVLRRFRFVPARKGGQAVDSQQRVPFTFNLKEAE